MGIAYLGFGSNLGDRRKQILGAMELLDAAEGISVVSRSSLYETEPVGETDQPPFLNAAAGVETELSPRELLVLIWEIEKTIGRTPTYRWGPREIDIDIVLFENFIIDEEGLSIPHPRMHERPFVLVPLSEIAPEAVHPILGETIEELLFSLGPISGVTPWEEQGE
ncbi:MAG: 2-amino-4-hydroxy-6-hydroxymethyldihydropteridine diphosphokinase [Deltaproteobacteria bacterium]|nr:2-amino-4-hydroxy-6-hydroxymethyldihydropteridine diphosphokinase [Candidatus Zymogenaceae bacterium]